jgi:hypothetical protein
MGMLPRFKGYTVDARLRQFRKVHKSGEIDFIDWDSEKGDEILMQMNMDNPGLFLSLADAIIR